MEQKILETIKDAEMILVGIGEEFAPEVCGQVAGTTQANGLLQDAAHEKNTERAADEAQASSFVQDAAYEKSTERAADEAQANGFVQDAHGTHEKNAEQAADEASGRASAAVSSFRDECLLSQFYASLPDDHEAITAYNRLRELIGAKPYFVVTMNTDDLIYRSALENDLIVAPCGSMGKLQCGEHIVPAGPFLDTVLSAKERTAAVAAAQASAVEVASSSVPLCPVCGRPLQFHTVSHRGYMESGYLPQWEKYTKWLSCTLNRRLCILELGVTFRYPQVIRFPFEKTAYFNQKATMIRIAAKFPNLPKELSGRGISLQQNPVHFLNSVWKK